MSFVMDDVDAEEGLTQSDSAAATPADDVAQNAAAASSSAAASPRAEIATSESKESPKPALDECGVATDGKRFKVAETFDAVETLATVKKWTELPVAMQIIFLLFYVTLFFLRAPAWFFTLSFIFWRLMYNAGLGYLLHHYSKSRAFTNLFTQWVRGSYPNRDFFERNVSTKSWFLENKDNKEALKPGNKRYNIDKHPDEFNAWVAFQSIVDIILGTDFVSYLMFCVSHWEAPASFSFFIDIPLYLFAVGLIFFNVWAKSEAHRVLSSFGWYWGDFFFLFDKELIFDGVFYMFPHPMYTVGYSFFYGMGILTRSWTVLIVSFFAHMSQLLFLVAVENPHIEKTYGAMTSSSSSEDEKKKQEKKILGQYFDEKNELIAFWNFDVFRASDFFLLVIALYMVIFTLLPGVPAWIHVLHVIVWRLIHVVFLGFVLKKQSTSQWWTLRFAQSGRSKRDAFDSWKRLFNASLTLNHIAFVCCFFKMFEVPSDSSFFGIVAKLVSGAILIGVNIWGSTSTYEVLGNYGWFYGDFFIDEYVPDALQYTGIYRYLNNPETVLGFAAYYGMALMSSSWTMGAIALFSQLVQLAFVQFVEKPHMERKYGKERVRARGGISQQITMKMQAIPRVRYLEETGKLKLDRIKNEMNTLQDKLKNMPNDRDISERLNEVKHFLKMSYEIIKQKEAGAATPSFSPLSTPATPVAAAEAKKRS